MDWFQTIDVQNFIDEKENKNTWHKTCLMTAKAGH